MHEQTPHYANVGYAMNELPNLVTLLQSRVNQWAGQGYYGSQATTCARVYNYYLGCFDGNPATLNPLPPAEVAAKYVAAKGGPVAVVKLGRGTFQKADYGRGAELVKRLPKVATEMALNVLAYNLKRVMVIIGVAGLPEALAA